MAVLTIANAKAADYGLKIGLIWWVFGMGLASGYTIFSYRSASGKVGLPGSVSAQEPDDY